MKTYSPRLGWLAALSLWGLVSQTACGGPEGEGDPAVEASEESALRLARAHRPRGLPPSSPPPAAPEVAPPPGPEVAPPPDDCAICAKASACCEAVASGPPCTFSAVTCTNAPADARGPYVTSCMTLLDTVARAWAGRLPAACQ